MLCLGNYFYNNHQKFMTLSIVVLAAGKGKRMKSKTPKILHQIGGKPILEHVYNTARKLSRKIFIVYGHQAEEVRTKLSHLDAEWILQNELLGTGHAVMQALPHIADTDQVLVLVGDCPLVSIETLRSLVKTAEADAVGLVVADLADPHGFGRILKDQTGRIIGIIEEKDATSKQKQITTVNTGLITAKAKHLKKWLPQLKAENAQNEYYLTDIIAIANAEGMSVKAVETSASFEILGVNDRIQLANIEKYYQQRAAQELMLQGVTLIDPERFNCRGTLTIDKDVIIDINVILEGEVIIGEDVMIGANCIIKDSKIGKNVRIKPNTLIEGAVIADNVEVGPFARIRPGTELKANVKIGNFVEVKKSSIHEDSKVNHLSYIGDCIIGKHVNIGAGTITCNYDGANKHQTIIEDEVFVGSGTQLVAPLTLGRASTIGAGSVITSDTPPNQLTLSRVKQASVAKWQRPLKKNKKVI